MIWVWVIFFAIRGLQILVHVSICQSNPFWGYSIFDHHSQFDPTSTTPTSAPGSGTLNFYLPGEALNLTWAKFQASRLSDVRTAG